MLRRLIAQENDVDTLWCRRLEYKLQARFLLSELDVSGNSLGDEGGVWLFEFLDEYAVPLSTLSVRNCGIDVNAGRALRELLRHKDYLEHVDLKNNGTPEELFDIVERGRRRNPNAEVYYY